MKATEELLPLDIYCKRMQMTEEEIKASLERLYKGSELARYIYSDNLTIKASFIDGKINSQLITESGLVKAIHVYGYDYVSEIITNGTGEFIPELDEFCNLDFEGELW
jgi:predicted DNA-binding helix-hairpin-helix protein